MTDEEFRLKLGKIARRLDDHALLRLVVYSLSIAILLSAVVIAVAQWFSLGFSSQSIIVGFVATGLIVTMVIHGYRRYSLRAAARYTDEKIGLNNCLATALEMMEKHRTGGVYDLLYRDCNARIKSLDPSNVQRLSLPRHAWLVPLSCLLLVLSFYTPASLSRDTGPDPEIQHNLKRIATRLEVQSREVEKKSTDKGLEELKKLANETRTMARKMRSGTLSQRDSLKQLSSMQQKIESRQRTMSPELKKSLTSLHEKMSTALDREMAKSSLPELPNIPDLMNMLEDTAEKLERGDLTLDQKKKIAEQMEKLLKDLEQMTVDPELLKTLKELSQCLRSDKCRKGSCCSLDAGAAGLLKKAAQMLNSGQIKQMMNEQALLSQLMAQLQLSKQQVCKMCKKGQCMALNGTKTVGSEFGYGSTNEEVKGGPAEERDAYNRQSGRQPGDRGNYESLYDPQRLNQHGYISKLDGVIDPDGEFTYILVKGVPGKNEAVTPLSSGTGILSDQEIDSAIEQEHIPARYQEFVKDYFRSLQPDNGDTE